MHSFAGYAKALNAEPRVRARLLSWPWNNQGSDKPSLLSTPPSARVQRLVGLNEENFDAVIIRCCLSFKCNFSAAGRGRVENVPCLALFFSGNLTTFADVHWGFSWVDPYKTEWSDVLKSTWTAGPVPQRTCFFLSDRRPVESIYRYMEQVNDCS